MDSSPILILLQRLVKEWDTIPVSDNLSIPFAVAPITIVGNVVVQMILEEVNKSIAFYAMSYKKGMRFSKPGSSLGIEIMEIMNHGQTSLVKINCKETREISILTLYAMIDNLGLEEIKKDDLG